ncbi:hypothetical protein PoB_002173500 [Plakobranchus ocellatus]|uniref:Uncharacterized protein n=1 Tax=Plakobranchus ocellatus TaxID=259542 RepID=A0AAV3ZKZ7_9GAST|nr:hypothetical protein PoB_002173500 [Plakobranchus ocellatus]
MKATPRKKLNLSYWINFLLSRCPVVSSDLTSRSGWDDCLLTSDWLQGWANHMQGKLWDKSCTCTSTINKGEGKVSFLEREGPHILERPVKLRASPQQGDLRLSGPPSGQGAGGGARTRDRRVPADLRIYLDYGDKGKQIITRREAARKGLRHLVRPAQLPVLLYSLATVTSPITVVTTWSKNIRRDVYSSRGRRISGIVMVSRDKTCGVPSSKR